MVNERPRVTRGRAVLLLIGALLVTGVLGFGASRLGDPELGRTASSAAARATPGPSAFDLALTLPVGAPADELPRTLPEKTGVSRFLVGSIDVTLRDEALWASPLPDDDWLIATAPTRDGRARQVDLMRAFPAHPAESLTSTSGVFALSPDRRSVVTVIWSADGNPNSYVLTVLDIATGAETATRTLTGEPRRLVAWTAEGIIVQGRQTLILDQDLRPVRTLDQDISQVVAGPGGLQVVESGRGQGTCSHLARSVDGPAVTDLGCDAWGVWTAVTDDGLVVRQFAARGSDPRWYRVRGDAVSELSTLPDLVRAPGFGSPTTCWPEQRATLICGVREGAWSGSPTAWVRWNLDTGKTERVLPVGDFVPVW